MIRRSGNKIYTKVTQYFTDDNSTVGYSHSLTSPTESFCGTNFYYEQRLTSSLANGRWRDCLYGPFTFCSGSTSANACESGNCNQFYLDTSTINIDLTGVVLDETSNVTLYTGSRMYLSSSLELAPDGYYVSGGIFYQVGTGNLYGYNAGTIIISGSCDSTPSSSVTASTTSVGSSMQPCSGGTLDDYMGASVNISNAVDVDTEFEVQVTYTSVGANCAIEDPTQTIYVTIPSGSTSSNFDACLNGIYFQGGVQICSTCINSCDNPNITILHGCF
jgi:hypothetical protein